MVSSLGPIGTKCPRWHIDHVPIRLVMSLVGPGCVYLPHEYEIQRNNHHDISYNLNRDALNSLDEDNTELANRILVPSDIHNNDDNNDNNNNNNNNKNKNVIVKANTGDVVLR